MGLASHRGTGVAPEALRTIRRLLRDPFRDLHFAARSLRKSPLFTTVAVLSVALGIGANAAVFTLLDQVGRRG